MATMNVLDSVGATVAIEKPLVPGRAAAASSRPVALSTEDAAFLDGIETLITSTNTKLDTLDTRVDTLETLIASTNTKLDTVITSVGNIDTGVPAALATGGGMKIAAVNAAGTQIDPVAAGSAAMTASVPVTIATDDTIKAPLAGVAHDAADTGNPIKIGGKAIAGLSGATLVAAADRFNLSGGLDGAAYVREVPLEDLTSGFSAGVIDTTATEIIAAPAAGIKTYLRSVNMSNNHASTNALVKFISGATDRTGLFVIPPGGRQIFFSDGLAPNAAAEAWKFQASVGVTTLYASSAVGFKSKV